MNRRGRVFVISGPSGVGKGTIIKQVLQRRPETYFSVSATTRAPRPGERDGVDYHFLTGAQFEALRDSDGLIEWAGYTGNFYGSPAAPVLEHMERGTDVLFDIEVQGAFQIKAKLPEAVLIFVMTSGFEELERRLRGRGTETEERIAKRLATARSEWPRAKEYDYIVVNDALEAAVDEVTAIMTAEGCRADARFDSFFN